MSGFGNDIKDDICDSIRTFIKENSDKSPSEIIEEVMEAVAYGLKRGLQDIES